MKQPLLKVLYTKSDKQPMKRLNKLFNYLIIILIMGYGAFYLFSDRLLGPRQMGKIDLSSNDVDQVVNKYLKQTTESMQKEHFETAKALYKALKQPLVLTKKNTQETNPDDVPVSKQIWREADVQVSPADVVNTDLYNQTANENLDEAARRQYAKDFIDNARRGGFHVVLTDDLTEIKSVTPIRKPSQQNDSIEPFPSN